MDAIDATFKDQESDLEQLFQELEGGFKIQVLRLEPDWCKGTLGTFDFMAGESVTTDWLVEKFGGRKLQVRILHADSSYNAARTIIFPKAPREDGIEIVKGPDGAPITVHERDAAKERPAPPPQQQNDMSGLFTTMLEMQTQQANQMQSLMMTLLSKTLDSSNNAPVAPVSPPPVPVNPQAHMKDTLEMFKTMEELRGMMSTGGQAESDPENPLLSMVIDKAVEKFTGPAAQPQQPQQAQQQLGNLPPGPIAPAVSNTDFALEAKRRLKTMSEQERELLLSHVFEEEEEETPVVSGQEYEPEVESLLTPEDQEQLGDEPNNSENEGETI